MESLRGIFPTTQPPSKRDFLKENVMRIRNMQRLRNKPSMQTEYSKYNKQIKPRKFSLSENNIPAVHRSSLALCSSKVPLNNLRKSVSSMSIQHRQKECGTQTTDTSDDLFLKDSIIRYPSASTIRSVSTVRPPSAHHTQVCSRGHQMEPDEPRPRFKSHIHDRKDEHCEMMDRHISNLSEFLDRGSISKKQPTSILKNSSASTGSQKSNKNYINEFQQKEHRVQKPEVSKQQSIVISDDEDDDLRKEKQSLSEKKLEADDARKQQLKAAEEDPNCPEGHVPLPENERLEALKLAQKRMVEIFAFISVNIHLSCF